MTDDTREETPNPVLKKTISLERFKSWLEGVEEMQEDGWHPSAAQWKTIRDKFDLIREEETAPAVVNNVVAPAPIPLPIYQPPNHQDAWSNSGASPMPATDMTPAARALLNGESSKMPEGAAPAMTTESSFL